MTAEQRGVPAIGIMTTAFVDAAEVMAIACGMPGYQFAVIDHPVSSATDAELEHRAAMVLERAAVLLAVGSGQPADTDEGKAGEQS